MTTKEKIELIQKVVTHKTTSEKCMDDIDNVFHNLDFPLANEYYNLLDNYVFLIEKTLGDSDGWVSWFIFDNNCGKNNLKITFNGISHRIGSVKKLVTVVFGQKD
jgi:hypothetical protein